MTDNPYIDFGFQMSDVSLPDTRFYVAGMAVAGHILGRTITYADSDYSEEVRFDELDREHLVYGGACVGFQHDEFADPAITMRHDIVCQMAGVYALKLLAKDDTSKIFAEDDRYFVPRCKHEWLFCTLVPRYRRYTDLYDKDGFPRVPDDLSDEAAGDERVEWVMSEEERITQELWDETGDILRENEDLIASLAVVLMEHGWLRGHGPQPQHHLPPGDRRAHH